MSVAMNAATKVTQREVSTPLSPSPETTSPGDEPRKVASKGHEKEDDEQSREREDPVESTEGTDPVHGQRTSSVAGGAERLDRLRHGLEVVG